MDISVILNAVIKFTPDKNSDMLLGICIPSIASFICFYCSTPEW